MCAASSSAFLTSTRVSLLPWPAGPAEDQLFADLFNRGSQGPADVPLNDLPGVLAHSLAAERKADQQAPTATAQQLSSKPPLHHRAVVTSMPMPATTRAGAAAATLDDNDTSSQATMPMPARKRRRSEEEDEACSSPNDLVEVPVAAQTAAARKRHHAAVTAAAQQQQQHDAVSSKRDQSGGAASAAGAAASSPGVKKGILVAKVLTKSDANSKRVILPRIAVETNLPQLTSAPHFHFTATDPEGASWPLVIKAWANGSNPKPVFVMEMIGDVLKQYRLTIGDALALLADEDGRFYLEWNTAEARQAAARPTYSGIVFKSNSSSAANDSGNADAAAPAPPAAGESTPDTPTATAGSPVPVAVKQEQAQQQQPAAAAEAAGKSPFADAAATASEPAAGAAVPVEQEQQEVAAPAPVSASQQQQLFQQLPSSANVPLMTAIPVTSPQVPGTFIPTSPCQLLVVGHLPMPDLDLDLEASLQPSLPSGMLGQLNSNGDVVMPAAAAGAAAGASGLATAQSAGDEGLLVPTGAVPQLAHAGGVLLCPRTPGCSRPAGHQGWCLGHKGYKKRRA